ncbi:MAG: hypothetical protein KGH65_03840 [Candidatus Micrarchaeota archaeon]|nr:hypothetical protein [Candidatus Micrarchaeota archaeon]
MADTERPVVKFIPFWDVDKHWDFCAPLLKKAVDLQTGWDLPSIKNEIMAGRMHLWATDNAAFVTQLQTFPLARVCVIFLCGGIGVDEWANEVTATLANYAKAHGCSSMVIVGRDGWEKRAPGFVRTDSVFRRAL